MNFKKDQFSELLKKAIGKRQHKDFAAQIGITPSHLSRMLHQKYDHPPSFPVLQKIAAHAYNSISYQDLLCACGYIDTTGNPEMPFSAVPSSPLSEKQKRIAKATIFSALDQCSLSWKPRSLTENDFDLIIEFPESDLKCWYFQFLPSADLKISKQQRLQIYLRFLFQQLDSSYKYSLVTSSPDEYQLYTGQLPVNLRLNLSIILIHEADLIVLKEQWLSRIDGKDPVDGFCFQQTI